MAQKFIHVSVHLSVGMSICIPGYRYLLACLMSICGRYSQVLILAACHECVTVAVCGAYVGGCNGNMHEVAVTFYHSENTFFEAKKYKKHFADELQVKFVKINKQKALAVAGRKNLVEGVHMSATGLQLVVWVNLRIYKANQQMQTPSA